MQEGQLRGQVGELQEALKSSEQRGQQAQLELEKLQEALHAAAHEAQVQREQRELSGVEVSQLRGQADRKPKSKVKVEILWRFLL